MSSSGAFEGKDVQGRDEGDSTLVLAHAQGENAIMTHEKSKTAWVDFEDEVYEAVRREVAAYRLMVSPKATEVFRRKGYFSRDRGKEIFFDVAVEAYVPPSREPSIVWPWECKNYPNRPVKVDEIEEFWAKMQQVSASHGTVVTRVGFEEGAVEFAKSKRIGLATLDKRLLQVTHYAAGAKTHEIVRVGVLPGALLTSGVQLPITFDLLEQIIQIELRQMGLLG